MGGVRPHGADEGAARVSDTKTSQDEKRLIESVSQLREVIDLESITYTRVLAERADDVSESDEDHGGAFNLTPAVSTSGRRLRIEMQTSMEARQARFEIRLLVFYTMSEPVRFDGQDVIVEFMGESTILSVAPHIREAIQSSAARLGTPVPRMGLLRPMGLVPADEDYDASELDYFED